MTFAEMKLLFGIYVDDRDEKRWPGTTKGTLLNRAQEVAQNLIDAQDETYFALCQDVSVEINKDSHEFDMGNFPSKVKDILHAERVYEGDHPVRARLVTFARRHEEKRETPQDTLFYLRGNFLGVVAPTAAFELRVWYIKKLADLSADGDISEIPSEFHRFMVLQAARDAMLSEQRDFSAWEGEYQADMKRMEEGAAVRQRAGAQYIHVDED